MPTTKERVNRLTLTEFQRYVDDSGRRLLACYKETEEVQFQFNDVFKQELDAWQETFAYCYPRLAVQRQDLPLTFARHVDQVEAEERERIRQEIAELDQQLRDRRAKMDDLLSQGQAATDALRTANPGLNDREEDLKALVVRYQDEYAQAFEDVEALEASPLGWMRNYFKIRRLKKVQRMAKSQQAHTLTQLRKVRQEWLSKVEEAGDTQAEFRDQWQEAGIKASEAQGRRDHLESNFDALAEQAALQRVLEELREPPDVAGDLGDALKELVERNIVRWNYEEGLRAVAEALGLLKGIGEGLKRFQRSLQTVLQEQRRYSLSQVHVHVPQLVIALNQTWEEIGGKVKDEKYMGTHPLEFSRIVDRYIKERFTDQGIQSYFELMGEALNRATAAWE